jgi:ATP-binding cassette subfamily F protein 2
VLISHSQDFLNGVCTNIMHLNQRKLKYYTVSISCFIKEKPALG